MIFPRTLAVSNKLIRDIEKTLFRTTIVVQCIFFVYYGYSIYTNMTEITYLIPYSLLLVISTISFVHYLSSYRKEVRGKQAIKQTFRIFKYVVNGSMLILNTVELIRNGGTEVAYGFIIFSTVSLLIQIMIEFIRVFTSQYIELFTIAIDKDTAFMRKVSDANLLTLVDAPLEMIAKKLGTDVKQMTKNEELVESLTKEHKETGSLKRKEKSRFSRRKQRDKIKKHFNVIKENLFTSNKKKDE